MALYAGVGWAFNARLGSMMAQPSRRPEPSSPSFVTDVWGVWRGESGGLGCGRLPRHLMFHIGFISLQSSIDDVARGSRGRGPGSVGVINVPIIYFSVQWWNSLHQGATITASSSKMAPSMRSAMLIMVAACWLYSIAVVLVRVRHIIREREQEAPWLSESAA